jgi:hypothetical protein
MGVIHGTASWPGAIAVESCTYTCSHGITPGVAILRIQPQLVFPDTFGDLVISDGNKTVVIPGCKLDALKVEQDESGTVWSLEIVDRRWKWRTLGFINGAYNQLDIHAKLYPWTIRSPTELAEACLAEMGETGFAVVLPPGLNYPGPLVEQPIVNSSGVNPPINWEAVPPAQALQQLADLFGARVIYQLATDTVLVCPAGSGSALPPGSIHKQGPSIRDPETPSAVGVIGAPTRYQVRLALEAVGQEWDGSFRPVNYLSYAPKSANAKGQTQRSSIFIVNPSPGVTWKIILNGTQIAVTCGTSVVATALGEIAAAINANAMFAAAVAATVFAGAVDVVGRKAGRPFDLSVEISPPENAPPQSISSALVRAAVPPTPPGAGDWSRCLPPQFPCVLDAKPGDPPLENSVQGTDRLTPFQAQELARKSVWRVYRLTGVDVSGSGPIRVPGYPGALIRRQQIVLQDTQVDQVVPEPKDATIIGRDNLPLTINLYNLRFARVLGGFAEGRAA